MKKPKVVNVCKTVGCMQRVTRMGLCRACLEAKGLDPQTGLPVRPTREEQESKPIETPFDAVEAMATSEKMAATLKQLETSGTPVCQAKDKHTPDDAPLDEDYLYSISPFVDLGVEIGKLVTRKNKAYGDSFVKCQQYLELLYPNGIRPDQYGDMLGLARIFDKQMRIATAGDAFEESPWSDIAGYGILGEARVRGL